MNAPLGGTRRSHVRLLVAALAGAAVTLALVPAFAAPLAGTDTYPKVAVLARNDVPFDAQTAGPMAAALGAPIFITSPTALSQAARDGIAAFNPTVLIVAGGPAAISDGVAAEAAAACEPDCTIDRRSGEGRDETAVDLATIPGDYGFTRPSLIGDNQVVGDLNVGGAVNADSLTVQDDTLVTNLNADLLDGMDASAFASNPFAVVTERIVDSTGSTSFVDLDGATVDITVPEGRSALVVAEFTAESACYDGPGWCSIELLANGEPMHPHQGQDFAFDSTDANTETQDSWESHAVTRSTVLGAGTHTIDVQWSVTDAGMTFWLDDWHLLVEAKLEP